MVGYMHPIHEVVKTAVVLFPHAPHLTRSIGKNWGSVVERQGVARERGPFWVAATLRGIFQLGKSRP